MSYFSEFYKIEVRDSIAKEFTNTKGDVDDMMAGLHEVRARMSEKNQKSMGNKEKSGNDQLQSSAV